jgi:transposase
VSNIYKEGENRKQQMFFPPSIDEYVSQDNPVRVIDDYVELLDMVELGFTKSALNSADGQPAYHPKLLLKIYIYGYLNKIRSSRKLELEIKRNIEMMWLCSNLKPSNKTISNFRKENAKPLKKVFREFVLLCKNIDLITGEIVAIGGEILGSKFWGQELNIQFWGQELNIQV